jgi:hypothetical protein
MTLAVIMGCPKVLLLGVDMSNVDPKARPWERGLRYLKDSVIKGTTTIFKKWGDTVQVLNLSPIAQLPTAPKVKHWGEALEELKKAQCS